MSSPDKKWLAVLGSRAFFVDTAELLSGNANFVDAKTYSYYALAWSKDADHFIANNYTSLKMIDRSSVEHELVSNQNFPEPLGYIFYVDWSVKPTGKLGKIVGRLK